MVDSEVQEILDKINFRPLQYFWTSKFHKTRFNNSS